MWCETSGVRAWSCHGPPESSVLHMMARSRGPQLLGVDFNLVSMQLVFIVVAVIVQTASAAQGDACSNTGGDSWSAGRCVLVSNCESIMAAVRRDGNIMSNATLHLLNVAHCGFNPRNKPLVCCPEGQVRGRSTRPPPTPAIQERPPPRPSSAPQRPGTRPPPPPPAASHPVGPDRPQSAPQERPTNRPSTPEWPAPPAAAPERPGTRPPRDSSWPLTTTPAVPTQTPTTTPTTTTPSSADVTAPPQAVDVTHPKARLLPLDSCGFGLSERILKNPNMLSLLDVRPSLARLAYVERGTGEAREEFRCGGSLISKRYVLTAAHCIAGLKPGTLLTTIVLGDFETSTEPDCEDRQERRVCRLPTLRLAPERVSLHPGYQPASRRNDVALIRLNQTVNFTASEVVPYCLPLGPMQFVDIPEDVWLRTSGWGMLENGTQESTRRMYGRVHLEAAGSLRCGPSWSSPVQFCASGQADMDCRVGDSGGPLTKVGFIRENGEPRIVQLGVEAYPVPGGGDSPRHVFTRVAPHLAWILDTIEP